jgi:hypothetical protein
MQISTSLIYLEGRKGGHTTTKRDIFSLYKETRSIAYYLQAKLMLLIEGKLAPFPSSFLSS